MGKKLESFELIGKIFGRLIVVGDLGSSCGRRMLKVNCLCGNTKEVYMGHLRGGKIVSCGCKVREETIKRNKKHGLTNHRLYSIWSGMRERCSYEKNPSYQYYGAKGVKVCNEWQKDFTAFYKWAIKKGYKEDLVLDRRSNKKGYCPSNCRWVTVLQNARNMSTNRNFKIEGKVRCVSEWCEIYGIKRYVVSDRINKLGWSFKKALLTPINK